MYSFGFALGLDGFFTQVHPGSNWVHPWSLDSLGYVIQGGTRVRARGRWVHPGSLGSLGSALSVVGFIRSRWVHSDAPWGLLGSSRVAGFTRERPVGRWLMRVRWVHPGWHSGTPCVALGSCGVVGFTRVSLEFRCVHPWWFGSLGCALGVVGFILGR